MTETLNLDVAMFAEQELTRLRRGRVALGEEIRAHAEGAHTPHTWGELETLADDLSANTKLVINVLEEATAQI